MHEQPARAPNRYDLPEWAGAFGDLGTLIPFVAAYVSILKMNANGLLVAFGIALIKKAPCGAFFHVSRELHNPLSFGCGNDLEVSEKVGAALAGPSSRIFQIVERVMRIPERQAQGLEYLEVSPAQGTQHP